MKIDLSRGCLTPREIAEKYGVSRARLFELLRAGELPRIKLSPRKLVVPTGAIEQYLADHLEKAPSLPE